MKQGLFKQENKRGRRGQESVSHRLSGATAACCLTEAPPLVTAQRGRRRGGWDGIGSRGRRTSGTNARRRRVGSLSVIERALGAARTRGANWRIGPSAARESSAGCRCIGDRDYLSRRGASRWAGRAARGARWRGPRGARWRGWLAPRGDLGVGAGTLFENGTARAGRRSGCRHHGYWSRSEGDSVLVPG